ncbi:MAG: bifunctional 4-hydroxy-2-oxoglutarate aldolase/2-dehydro-3-deoxy-phosphogluconate aldolase [Desulfobacterales bacterium]|jgi:2-dehydro-3-deoxyphosphogluconate aldolase/(4S)-4-hydroxy-2-oxoglutarate aldolase|nr:MAG: bifunctional 4-hydroxy-2-oxoglutarate aldolase/2-dehydro-3-deoxy-phosphogluconate aldolase [Desulfobacterales bacterium]
MAQFSKLEVLTAMEATGLIPVFYNKDFEVATEIVKACIRGGAKIVEFTNRGDYAYQVFGKLSQYFSESDEEVILGIGSVIDPYTAALYINNGANFIVGPVLNQEVAKICNRRQIPYSPGCGTASEISLANEIGCDIVKIFPGGLVGGPSFAKAVMAPCPWFKLMPTGGVSPTEESLSAWFEAGVACVGMGSKLITKDLVAAKDWKGIEENVRQALAIIKEVRNKK